jgi:hypothetical protein
MHLLLTLCVLRAADQLIYFYFFNYMSIPTVRLLTGLPHVLTPWILSAVAQ